MHTLLTFEDICRLMLEYDDFFIITDTKYLDDESNRRTFDIIRETIKAADPSLINRIAIQFYNREMFYFLVENYDFPRENMIFTLYKTLDTNRTVINFVEKEGIRAVTMWDHRAKQKDFVKALGDAGAVVYAHTVNDVDAINELFNNGVYGIYTDSITYEHMKQSRTGRYAILFEGLSSEADEPVYHAVSAGFVPDALQSRYGQPVTRGEFCALTAALFESVTGESITGRMPFGDTEDINVQKMGALGVVTYIVGEDFKPNDALTREQAAVIVARLADALGHPLPRANPVYADNWQISKWAVEAVGQIQSAGLITVEVNNLFNPQGKLTREQSIIIILKLFDYLNNRF
jgi:hypothetical protein